jgi:hypothetical protein
MATPDEILVVRRNTNQPDNLDPYTDDYIEMLIDTSGVSGATFQIWQQKAASHASLVDVTEAGASHKFSDMFKADSDMVKYWGDIVASEANPSTPSVGPRVKKIVRL